MWGNGFNFSHVWRVTTGLFPFFYSQERSFIGFEFKGNKAQETLPVLPQSWIAKTRIESQIWTSFCVHYNRYSNEKLWGSVCVQECKQICVSLKKLSVNRRKKIQTRIVLIWLTHITTNWTLNWRNIHVCCHNNHIQHSNGYTMQACMLRFWKG